MNRLAEELEGNEELVEVAKTMVERLSNITLTPPSSAENTPEPSVADSESEREGESPVPSHRSPQSTKKQTANSFSPTGSESSGTSELIVSQQTIQKKKLARRVPKSKTGGAGGGSSDSSDDNRSAASSPAFSDTYIDLSANEMMEEEITRAIALANQNKDLQVRAQEGLHQPELLLSHTSQLFSSQELTELTALFGEGSVAELKQTLPLAKKYLDMISKRDAMKNKFKAKNQLTAASPAAARTAHSSGKNADGTPFSNAQKASLKRRRAAKEGTMTPPQAATYIQLIFRGHTSRNKMRRRHRSATMISAIFLGYLSRRETLRERKRWHKVLQDEKVRHTRIKRIAKEVRRSRATTPADHTC